jgi:hypothetical protein
VLSGRQVYEARLTRQLEQLLRASSRPEPAAPLVVERPPSVNKVGPVLDSYLSQVEAANARADRLEKENLQVGRGSVLS